MWTAPTPRPCTCISWCTSPDNGAIAAGVGAEVRFFRRDGWGVGFATPHPVTALRELSGSASGRFAVGTASHSNDPGGDLHVVELLADESKIVPLHRASCASPVTAVESCGTDLVVGTEEGTVHVLCDEKLLRCTTLPAAVTRLCDTGYGACLAISQHVLYSWDRREPEHRRLASRGATKLTSLAVHPQKPHLVATGDLQGTIAFWDLRQASQVVLGSNALHSGDAVWDVKFAPVLDALLSCSESGLLTVWSATTPGGPYSNPNGVYCGVVPLVAVAVHPSSQALALAAEEPCVRVWERE